ncbi:MAG TPA: LuxR C-terminal-related transcriptional regulator, partial [Anaeromyxobacteraceae bacterium]|nr:LuxR C-terminal-related transcriptional regulator [Anaeromyxobacteraceae bacterium]
GARPAGRRLGRDWPIAALFGFIAVFAGLDLFQDISAGEGLGHVVVELCVELSALGGFVVVWRRFLSAQERARGLAQDLDRTRADLAHWRAEAQDALRGLGAAIDRQFARWQLTRAESEIALLLLKGLSLKEVASLRSTSERTVRQQALSVYRKAGLAGRAELAAFFLEDLLLPKGAAALAASPGERRG